jgi:hypothetical protein
VAASNGAAKGAANMVRLFIGNLFCLSAHITHHAA